MCRLYAFRSSILSSVHSSLVAAENALSQQSVRHPDGWGVAYYIGGYPHVIRNDRQALEDSLFREVSAVVSTRTLLAHIRQATVGKVGVLNCHPFQHGPWVFGHNGQISGYAIDNDVGQRVRDAVDPRFRRYILGSTDSEVCFYIFLSRLARHVEDIFHEGLRLDVARAALRETVETIFELVPEKADKPHRLTFVLTNGNLLLAYRYNRELFFSTYKSMCPERDECSAYEAYRCEQEVEDGIVKHLIVTSEHVESGTNVWVELDDGDYVEADRGMNFGRGRLLSSKG